MNSPNEGASPDSSSSSTPPPDEIQMVDDSEAFGPATKISSISDFSGSSKRRLPGGGSFASSSSLRDTKSRRKEDTGSMRRGPSNASWEGGRDAPRSKTDKDELLDVQLMENLRQQFGDPCDDSALKNAS